jgi:DNA-binding NarL/FixJ family response regulator
MGIPHLTGVQVGLGPSLRRMTDSRRLLVVEDEPLMSSLLAQALAGAGFVVETAADVLQARAAVRNFDPDGVLLDISLGDGPSGLDLAHVLHAQRPDIALIVLTKYPDPRVAGVTVGDLPPNCGFLRKDLVKDTDYLLEAINAVLTDRPKDVRHDLDPSKPLSQLSPKHLEVLRLMAMGFTNEFIGQTKGASQSTVERWTAEIFRALGIETRGNLNPRVEAVRQFISAAGVPDRL